MKKAGIALAAGMLLTGCATSGMNTAGTSSLTTDDQKASYAIGYQNGVHMQELAGLDLDALTQGMRDGFDEQESRLGDDVDKDQLLRDFQTRIVQRQQQEKQAQAFRNAEQAKALLQENAAKPGVEVTASGLQYQVLKSGAAGAPSPTLDDRVKVSYVGKLADGTVFDSSEEHNGPAVFGLKNIIKGWQEALPMMKVGDKWRIWIPPELGYGERGAGDQIEPNEVLVFDIQLLGIKAASDAAAE